MQPTPTRSFSFAGGSQGDRTDTRSGRLGCFQSGVRSVFPSDKKHTRRYRVLPAFNENLSKMDAAYQTSTVPYRLIGSTALDNDTKTEPFTGWYLTTLGYSMLGRSQEDFLSPQMLAASGFSAAESADPVQDARNLAKATPQWYHLTERTKEAGGRDKSAVLPYVSGGVLMNVLESDRPQDPSSWRNSILTVRETSLRELKKTLSWPMASGQRVLDPEWPQYCFGDVTSANAGCVALMEKKQVGTVQTWCLVYGARDFQNNDAVQMPVNESALRNRYQLGSEATLKFFSYQEIVDWMISDGAFPHELIAQACGHAANISVHQGHSYAGAVTGGKFSAAPQHSGPVHNPMAPPMRADQLDMSPSPKAPDVKFWVMAHGAVQPAPVELSVIRTWSPELLAGVKMMDEGQRTPWSDPSAFGVVVAPAAPPPPPAYQAPAAPLPPPAYQAPAVPVYQAPAAPVYQAPAAPPTSVGLTPEEEAEWQRLSTMSTTNIASMSPPDFVQLASLAAKRSAQH